jgi:hypothetical protein
MKNKILTCIFATGLVLGLAACGGKSAGGNEDKVLEDTENAAWVLHGNFELSDGTVNGWNGKDNELYEASKMTAISIKEAKAISASVGEKLAAKKVKYLYKYEGARFGHNDAGWSGKFLDAERNLFQANGSYAFKAAKVSYDAEEEVYAEQTWMPDPKVSYAESLDGNIFFPRWTETFDEDGFSWAQDNFVRSGAGVYTVIVAQYDNAPAYPDSPNYGFAIVKTGDVEGGQEYVPLEKFVPGDHTYGVIGLNGDWSADIAMVRDGENLKWTKEVTAEAATNFKVRADGAWDYSWGFASVSSESTYEFTNADGNIGVAAGTFTVEITFDGVNGTIKLLA